MEERQSIRQTYEPLNELATKKYRLEVRLQQLMDEAQQVRKEIMEVENQLHHGLIKAQPTIAATVATGAKPKHAKSSDTEAQIRKAMQDPAKLAQIVELLKEVKL